MKADGKKMKIAVGTVALTMLITALALAAYRSVNTPERALERYFDAVSGQDLSLIHI